MRYLFIASAVGFVAMGVYLVMAPPPEDDAVKEQIAVTLAGQTPLNDLFGNGQNNLHSPESLRISYPHLTDDEANRFAILLKEEADKHINEAQEAMKEAMVSVYTLAELRAIARAYSDTDFVSAVEKQTEYEGAFYRQMADRYRSAQELAIERARAEGLDL